MLRIGQVEATATQDGKYTDGSVAGGIAATRLRAAAFNAMQEELAHIVESAGLALDINDMTQVLKAIQKLTLSRINPFADIKSDGAAAISTALANLGLGTAATKNVGTGSGQIPDMSSFNTGNTNSFRLPTGHFVQIGSGQTISGGF
ncbi:TPA: gp53-like domain-containing protein, partial [Enterobacter hormaechei subsp. steigerwaltii]